jgi:shikimate kinase
MEKNNIVLIGMPSSGKSTVGKFLAEKSGMQFIDTDLMIYKRVNKSLKDIVNHDGLEKFLDIQQEVVTNLTASNSIISTGGSVVYSKGAMEHLKKTGKVIFLKLDYNELAGRITTERRFARTREQNLMDMYNERMPLYEKYADVTVECSGKSVEKIAGEIEKLINIKSEGVV